MKLFKSNGNLFQLICSSVLSKVIGWLEFFIFCLNPLFQLALCPPSAPLLRVLRINDVAYTMLHAVVPLTTVFTTVRVRVCAHTVLLVVAIVAFVLAAILPNVIAVAMHHSVLELALEVAAVSPLEAPIATHLIGEPMAGVFTTICPEVTSSAFLHTHVESAVIVAAIAPDLDSHSILFLLEAGYI